MWTVCVSITDRLGHILTAENKSIHDKRPHKSDRRRIDLQLTAELVMKLILMKNYSFFNSI